MLELLLVVVVLLILGATAQRWGADTRPGFDGRLDQHTEVR